MSRPSCRIGHVEGNRLFSGSRTMGQGRSLAWGDGPASGGEDHPARFHPKYCSVNLITNQIVAPTIPAPKRKPKTFNILVLQIQPNFWFNVVFTKLLDLGSEIFLNECADTLWSRRIAPTRPLQANKHAPSISACSTLLIPFLTGKRVVDSVNWRFSVR